MNISDDQLLELVGRALRTAEPVPDRVVTGARAAWTWRTIDDELAELAELVFDSAQELTGVRSEDTARQLTFRAPGVEIEVMVVDDGARRIVGQLIPPGAYTVQLAAGEQVLDEQSDRLGRFTFEPVPLGPVRISVTGADGIVATTEWVLL